MIKGKDFKILIFIIEYNIHKRNIEQTIQP